MIYIIYFSVIFAIAFLLKLFLWYLQYKKPIGVLRLKETLSREQYAKILSQWKMSRMKDIEVIIVIDANDSDFTLLNPSGKDINEIKAILNEDRSKDNISGR